MLKMKKILSVALVVVMLLACLHLMLSHLKMVKNLVSF